MSKPIEAWCFSDESRKLRHGDRRDIAIGVRHTVKGKPDLCNRGLHASVKLIDALQFAPGPILWRVRVSGTIEKGDDKICGTVRTYLAGGFDATEVLRAFSRRVALDVAHLWNMPYYVRQYLETSDESLRAAALAAAWDAAVWDAAAWDAALNAAAATRAASAAAAARDAARAASAAAAWNATAATRDAAAAAAAAAWDARAAAWAKYAQWIEKIATEAMEGRIE